MAHSHITGITVHCADALRAMLHVWLIHSGTQVIVECAGAERDGFRGRLRIYWVYLAHVDKITNPPADGYYK